jgi:hypothetical protein
MAAKRKSSSSKRSAAVEPSPASVRLVLAQAKHLSTQIASEDDAIARLALLHPGVAVSASLLGSTNGETRFSLAKTSDIFGSAKRAFEQAKAQVKKIVCTDLQYCKNKDSVSSWLDEHLPEIAAKLLKGGPSGFVAKILAWLGIGATSWASVVAIVVAWLIKTEIDQLCGCK